MTGLNCDILQFLGWYILTCTVKPHKGPLRMAQCGWKASGIINCK
jgi:hypothetical protein